MHRGAGWISSEMAPGALPGRIRWLGRLAALAAASAGVIVAFWIGAIWLSAWITPGVLRKAEIILLGVIAIAYAAAALLGILGVPLVGALWLRGRRKRTGGSSLARGAVLCGSLLVAVVLAEAGSAAWQFQRLLRSPVPVGGLRPNEEQNQVSGLFSREIMPELPTRFTDPPGDRTIDVVVLGESSAFGVPFEKWLSPGKIVAWQLEKAVPSRPIRLSILARSGDTLEGQHGALAKLAHRPDLLIVYCGHNEFSSRLYWRRNRRYYADTKEAVTIESRFDRLLAISAVCRLIYAERQKCLISIPPLADGRRALIDAPAYSQVEYAALLADFQARLDAIVGYAQSVGSLVVLIMPAGNDAGFDPNRSSLPEETPKARRDAFARAVIHARRLEAGDPAAALAEYRALVAAQPGFAEVHYRLARLLEQAGRWDEAYEHYALARDRDGYPERILTEFQMAYREVAARRDCILIDGQAYFHALGQHGLLGDDLFQDAMHPSLRGQLALAQAVLHVLKDRGAFGWPSEYPAPIIDPAECALHFGIGPRDWAHVCGWSASFNAMVGSFRYESSQRHDQFERYLQAKLRIDAGVAPESLGLPNIGIPRPVPLLGFRLVARRKGEQGLPLPEKVSASPPLAFFYEGGGNDETRSGWPDRGIARNIGHGPARVAAWRGAR
jgi:lysophospholipase L1-like esterase